MLAIIWGLETSDHKPRAFPTTIPDTFKPDVENTKARKFTLIREAFGNWDRNIHQQPTEN